MRLKTVTKKVIAYMSVMAMMVTSMTGYQAQVSAAEIPADFTQLKADAWNALGEEKIYKIGTDNQPASIWNVYVAGGAGQPSVGAKDGADNQDNVSLFIAKETNEDWGIQLGRIFIKDDEENKLVPGKRYTYTINYEVNGTSNAWVGTADADGNGRFKVEKGLRGIAKEGETLKITDTSVKEFTLPDEEVSVKEAKNLAYKKKATVSSFKEGNDDVAVLTDGIFDKWDGNYIGGYTPGYFEVDLGQEYAAESIDKVVVWFRNGETGLYPEKGFRIQFGDVLFNDVAKVTKFPAGASSVRADGNQFMVSTTLDKANLKGNVRKVRIQIDDKVDWGAQITEIAVYSENPQGPVAVGPVYDAESVAVSSQPSQDFTGNIKFNIKAGANQAGYKYAAFLDDETAPVLTDCVAGKDYTLNGIEAGTHTIKIVAINNYAVSAGITSDEVNVSTRLDGYEGFEKEGWHPLGAEVIYTVGTDNKPGSIWNVFTSDWAGAVVTVKDGADDQDTVSIFVKNKPSEDWGLQLAKVFPGLEPGMEYAYKMEYTVDGVKSTWEEIVKADANGIIKVEKSIGGIVVAGKLFEVTSATISKPCSNAKAVSVSSEKTDTLTGEIVVNITADDDQDGYTYSIFLDEATTASYTGCEAGTDYKISSVPSGTHTVKVISSFNNSLSTGIVSAPVEVKTIIDDIKDYSKNFAYKDQWELKGGNSSEGSGSITDGVASRDNYSTPEKAEGPYFIIDLEEECNTADIKSVYTCFRHDGGGFPDKDGMVIEYSVDKEEWTEAAKIAQADFTKQRQAQKGEIFGISVDVSDAPEGTVRYVKIYCPENIGWGMQVTEIAIFGDVPESQVPKAPAAPTGLKENEMIPYTFVWDEVEGAASYKIYINGEVVGTSKTASYNAMGYFAVNGAGDYTVAVSAVEGRADLESEKTEIEYAAKDVKPIVSEDGNYMMNPVWDFYIGDWIWCEGTMDQTDGTIEGNFVTTGGGWNDAVWGIKATSAKFVVDEGKTYTYSATITSTKNIKMTVQSGNSEKVIEVKANTPYNLEMDVTPSSMAVDVLYALGGGLNGTVEDVQFTISDHRFVVKKVEDSNTGNDGTDNNGSSNNGTGNNGTGTTTVAPTTVAPTTVATQKVGTAKIKKATKKASATKASLTLKKVKGAKGYAVAVATSKKFNKKTTVKVKAKVKVSKKAVKVTISKLKANKVYYVRVRAYKKVNGKKVFGNWCKPKKIKNTK